MVGIRYYGGAIAALMQVARARSTLSRELSYAKITPRTGRVDLS